MFKEFWNKHWPLLFLCLAVLVFFARLVYPQRSVFVTPDFGTSDLLNFNYPFREFLSQSLKSGQLPLWVSSIGSGFPFLAEGQAGTFFLPNIIASLLSNIALNMFVSYVFYFLLMGVFTYLFCREINLGRGESLLVALVFTFSGVNLTHVSHPNQLAVVSVLPLQFFLLEKFFQATFLSRQFNLSEESPRIGCRRATFWLILFSFATSQSIMAGYLQPAVYGILALGVYFVLRLALRSYLPRKVPTGVGTGLPAEALAKASATSQDVPAGNRRGFLMACLQPIGLFVFSLVLAVGLSAIQFLPSWELSQQSSRRAGLPESILKLYPYPPKNLLTFLSPNWFGTPRDGTYPMFSDNWGIYWENTGYVGLIPLGLTAFVILALILWLTFSIVNNLKTQISNLKTTTQKSKLEDPITNYELPITKSQTRLKIGYWNFIENWKLKICQLRWPYFFPTSREQIGNFLDSGDRKVIVIFILLLVMSLLLVLGKYTPLFSLYKLPPLSYFRVPSRWLIIVDFSLAILAGFGLKMLREWLSPSKSVICYLLSVICLFDLWFYFFNFNPTGSFRKWIQTPPQIAEFLKNQKSDFRYYEVGSTIAWNMTFVDKGWQNNLESFYKLREGLRPSNNVLYDLPSAGIYAGLLPKRTSELINLTDASFVAQPDGSLAVTDTAVKLLGMQNAKYVVSPFFLNHPNLKPLVTTKFPQPDANFIVYENTKLLPRAYLVNHFRLNLVGNSVSSNLELIKKGLIAQDFKPQESVILEEDPHYSRLGNLDNSSATIIKDSGEKLSLKVSLPSGNGLLVLADSYYPGWKAFIDGKETEILVANLNQRAIIVPQGKHQVEFLFQPQSVKTGVVISILSLVVLLVWFLVPYIKYSKKSS